MTQSCEKRKLRTRKSRSYPYWLTASASFISNLRLIVKRVLQEEPQWMENNQSQVTGDSVVSARPALATDFALGTWKESEVA